MHKTAPWSALPARALFLLILLVPLTAYPHIWPLPSAVPDGLTIFLAIALGAVGLMGTHTGRLPLPAIGVVLGLFILSVSISGVLAGAGSNPTAFRWQLFTLAALLLSLLGLGRIREQLGDDGYGKLMATGLTLLGALYAVGALVLHYAPFAFPGFAGQIESRLEGLWGQPNLTTSTLWLALFSGLFLSARTGYRKTFLLGVVLIGTVCALAASRLNILFLLLAAVLAWASWRYGQTPLIRRQGRWLTAAVLLFAICLIAVPPMARFIQGSTQQASLVERDVSNRRVIEHEKIVSSLPDWSPRHWILGIGPGNYAAYSHDLPVRAEGAIGRKNAWLHSHNLFSTLLVEQGLLGVAVVLAVISILLIRLWRIRQQPLAIPITGVLGVLFLHSNVEFPLWYPWFAFVLIAIALPLFGTFRVAADSTRLLNLTGALMLIFSLVVGTNMAYQVSQIQSVARGEDPGRSGLFAMRRLEADTFLGHYATLVKYRRFSPPERNLDAQLERVREIAAWRPLDIVKVRHTVLLMMDGQTGAACTEASRTAARFPLTGPIIVQKAVVLGIRSSVDIGRMADCVEQGLSAWDTDLESVQQHNQERAHRAKESAGAAD